ncbi:hypothetical protein BY458DRAFT_526258 [Sporodiniella umbellata]|nr:hypothetical protein BY458DRAFT_526258 [Sporodiniella umbellata]
MYKNWMTVLLFGAVFAVVSCFELNKEITGTQRLEKRFCDFNCNNPSACESHCQDSGENDKVTGLLAVCHDGKCYCGFIPN